MTSSAGSQERRQVLAVARRYRRDGYNVNGPDKWSARPMFLGDIVPDLIAERDDDKVVVEVKRAGAVPGANDIVELAARVSEQPGWRFELIAVPSASSLALPDSVGLRNEIEGLVDKGFLKAAFVVACAAVDNLVAYATVIQNRNPANQAISALTRDLVVIGALDEDTRQAIDNSRARRNELMHDGYAPIPDRWEIAALLDVADVLYREVIAVEEH